MKSLSFKWLLPALVALLLFVPHATFAQQAPALVNCAPSTPCTTTGPSSTNTGMPAYMAFGTFNADFLLSFSVLQPALTGAVVSSGNSNFTNLGAIAGNTTYCNTSGSAAAPTPCTVSQMLNLLLGTASPSLVGGSNVAITGTWPNQTISFTGTGAGTVTTTGSPSSGELSCFSGSTSIVNCNLSGDVATSNTGVVTVSKIGGVAVGTLATANAASPPALGGTTPAAVAATTLSANAGITSGTPSGGNLGAGTINGVAVYQNGTPVGPLGLPVSGGSAKTIGYTYLLGDNGQQVVMNCASACVLTIPSNASVAFPYSAGGGTCLVVDVQPSSAVVTLAITTDKITNYTTNTPYTNQTVGALPVPYLGTFCKDGATTWYTFTGP